MSAEKLGVAVTKGSDLKLTLTRAASVAPSAPQPPSPTASLNGDKYVLVRVPKPTPSTVLSHLSSEKADQKVASNVEEVDRLADQKLDLDSKETTTVPLLRQPGLKSGVGVNPYTSRMQFRRTAEGMKLRSIYSLQLGCDAAGLSNVTADVLPSANSTEWAAVQALYEEWRVTRLRLHIWPCARWVRSTSATSVNPMAVGVSFATSVQPGGVRQIMEMTNHTLFYPRMVTAGATSAGDVYSYDTNGEPRILEVKIPKGVMIAGSAPQYVSGGWQSTFGPFAMCAIKLYAQTSNASDNVCIIYVESEILLRERAF